MQTLPRITQTNLKVSFSRPKEWKIHKSDLRLLNIFSSYILLFLFLFFLAVEENNNKILNHLPQKLNENHLIEEM